MKILFLISFLITHRAETPSLPYLRSLFADATQDEVSARQLIEITENEVDAPVIKGYYGAGKILMARFYFNPYTKYSSFKKGVALLEEAILADPTNVELRFLRLSIQHNAPSFLGYHKHTEQDKLFLYSSISTLKDEELKLIIDSYLTTLQTQEK
jgi:hypothetical protein